MDNREQQKECLGVCHCFYSVKDKVSVSLKTIDKNNETLELINEYKINV